MTAYYNENNPDAAAWLRELIADGLIAPGDVDERSIEDVAPADLAGYGQCHFFAGIGGWSLALRLAGVPDDEALWTASCPCQPFSAAGARGGVDDPRHLWPALRWLIDQCRPASILGEQVASKSGRAWLAGVRTDLEAMGYGVGAADLCAAGVGAPHIRQRLFWLGHTQQPGLEGHAGHGGDRCEPGRQHADQGRSAAAAGGDCGLADAKAKRSPPRGAGAVQPQFGGSGPWDDAIWIPCADGKARRIEPGIEPLVDGLPRGVVPSCDPGEPGHAENTAEARRMRLSGYGNALVPHIAAEFVRAWRLL